MHSLGEYLGAQISNDGSACVMFSIDDQSELEKLEKMLGKKVVIDIKKFSRKRSLNANAYFWKLVSELSKKLGSDLETIYLMELKNYGVFDQIEVIEQGVELLKPLYRLIEKDHQYKLLQTNNDGEEVEINMISIKCYRGSHDYTSAQMSDLIRGTRSDAVDLGIDVWSDAEIDNLIQRWEKKDENKGCFKDHGEDLEE